MLIKYSTHLCPFKQTLLLVDLFRSSNVFHVHPEHPFSHCSFLAALLLQDLLQTHLHDQDDGAF